MGGKKIGFLATSDCSVQIQSNNIITQEQGINLEEFNELIAKANLSSLVLFLDCCHSGYFIERQLFEASLSTFKTKQDYYLITACRSFETAKTVRSQDHSVFSGALIRGLSQENADPKGEISCDRLFDFIGREIGRKLQEPLRMGVGGSIILVNHKPLQEILEPLKKDGEVICPYQGLEAFTKESKPFFLDVSG